MFIWDVTFHFPRETLFKFFFHPLWISWKEHKWADTRRLSLSPRLPFSQLRALKPAMLKQCSSAAESWLKQCIRISLNDLSTASFYVVGKVAMLNTAKIAHHNHYCSHFVGVTTLNDNKWRIIKIWNAIIYFQWQSLIKKHWQLKMKILSLIWNWKFHFIYFVKFSLLLIK